MYIYCLIDPRDNDIRYIGKTNDIETRFRQHLNHYKKDENIYKERWLNSLEQLGLKPRIGILKETDGIEWPFWEIFFIDLFRALGSRLTNIHSGGISPPSRIGIKHSVETKAKMSDKHKGRIFTEESRSLISRRLMGNINGRNKKASATEREAMSNRACKYEDSQILAVFKLLTMGISHKEIAQITRTTPRLVGTVKSRQGLRINKILKDL